MMLRHGLDVRTTAAHRARRRRGPRPACARPTWAVTPGPTPPCRPCSRACSVRDRGQGRLLDGHLTRRLRRGRPRRLRLRRAAGGRPRARERRGTGGAGLPLRAPDVRADGVPLACAWPGESRAHDAIEAEFAQAYVETPRIVFSDTLTEVPEGRPLVRSADASAEVARLKALPGGPLGIGGATLAASLAEHIDEFRMWVSPVIVGAGKPFFPPSAGALESIEARTMAGGVLSLRYARAS